MNQTNSNIMSTLRLGPASSSDLAARFGVTTSTITRQLNKLGPAVMKTGGGPATRWYASRPTPWLSNTRELPIYRVNSEGRAIEIARLYPVYPEYHYMVEYFRRDHLGTITSEWHHYESLPWWITDMRPQGFLGRLFARNLQSQGEEIDANPASWSDDLVLAVLTKYPQDHIGNLLIGQDAYQRWLAADDEVTLSDDQAGATAEAIARGEHFDSSAQGEQPKFTARLADGECIIKFSGRLEHPELDSVAGRWADLLHAEHLAAVTLNEILPNLAATNRVFTASNRLLLASKRFDRTEHQGRLGVISFASLDAEFVGQANRPWPVIAHALYQEKVITEEALTRSQIAWVFGRLIANTDMHHGNLSIINEHGRPYELAPVYDMLPMHYAPKSTGDLPSEPYEIKAEPNVPAMYWELAYPAAIKFWQRLIAHPHVSHHFKVLAQKQLNVVKKFAHVIQKMA